MNTTYHNCDWIPEVKNQSFGEWLPIESAPKNGSSFIGFQSGYGVNKTCWDAGHDDGNGGFRIYASHGWSPTLWMPLPQPPEDQQ